MSNAVDKAQAWDAAQASFQKGYAKGVAAERIRCAEIATEEAAACDVWMHGDYYIAQKIRKRIFDGTDTAEGLVLSPAVAAPSSQGDSQESGAEPSALHKQLHSAMFLVGSDDDLHDDECSSNKGYPCNCPSAAFAAKPASETVLVGNDKELRRAANALLNTLWQLAYSGSRTFEENWQEMDRRFPQARWLHDELKATRATSAEVEE